MIRIDEQHKEFSDQIQKILISTSMISTSAISIFDEIYLPLIYVLKYTVKIKDAMLEV